MKPRMLSLRDWPLAVSGTILITFLVAAVVITMTWFTLRREQAAFREELQLQAEVLLGSLGGAAGDALYQDDVDTVDDLITGLSRRGILVFGRAYDENGRILADAFDSSMAYQFSEDPFVQQILATETVVFDWQTDQLIAGQSIMAGRQVLGAISVGIPTSRLEAKLAVIRNQGVVLGLVTSLLGIVFALMITRFISNPLQALVRDTRQMAAGDMTVRSRLSGRSEIGLLGSTFNHLADELQQTINKLERRSLVVATSSEISRSLSTILDEQELVTAVVTTLQEAFNYYHVHIYLLNQTGDKLVMAGGTGEAGAQLLAENHQLPISHGLVGNAAERNAPQLVTDVTKNTEWMANPLLPETKSEIALPIASGDVVLGVLDVQSNVVDGLGQIDVELLQSITNQIAIALQNARQYEQVQRSEKSIQQRETLLRTIIDSTPDWIFVKDLDHRYQMVNRSYANSFDMTPADFIGKNDLDIGFPEEIVKGSLDKGIRGFWADDKEIMEKGDLKVIDVEPAVVDGEDRYLNTIKAPLLDSVGNITGVVGFVHDITDRIRTEEAVRERETLLRTIIDSTPDWIFVKDLDHRYLMVNKGYADSFHMTPDDFVGKNDLDIGFPEDIVKGNPEKGIRGFWADDREIMERGELKVIEAEPAEVDGEQRFLNTIKAPLKDSAGRVTGVVGFVHDITGLKQIEVALQEAQGRTQEVLESITVPLVISRITDGIVAYVNDPMAEVIRVPRDELIGQVTPDFYHDPADRQAYLTALREQGQVSNYDLRLKRGDGDLFWALISGRVIDFQGAPAIINSVIDINERREAQALVARRALELETVADVGTVAATILEPDELLQQVVELTKERFNLYHTHIYLLDEDKAALTLTNGAGEIGRTMVAERRQIALSQEQSLVARAARTREGVIINDVQAESGFLPHPLLPDTRAEMAVPFIAGQQVLGVLDVQADSINRFTAEDVSIFTTLASQVAVALQNARRYDEAQRALDDLSRLQRIMAREGWEAFLLAQEQPLSGFTFDGKGAKLVTGRDDLVTTVAETDEAATDTATAVAIPGSSFSIPIAVRGEQIGQLGLRNPDGSPITARKQALLQTISQQVSEALERARLAEQTQVALAETAEQARRRAVLNQTSEQLNRAETIDDIFHIVAENTAEILPSDRVTLAVLSEEGDQYSVMSLAGIEENVPVRVNQPLIGSFIEKAIQTGDVLVTHDRDPNPETGIRSSMIVPLVTGLGTIGTLNVGSKAANIYNDMDQGIAVQIASILSSVIENKRLLTETQQRAEEMALINRVVSSVARSLDIEQALMMVAAELGKAIGVDQVGIALLNQDQKGLTVMAEYETSADAQTVSGFVIPIEGNLLTQEVLRSGKTVLVEDAQYHPLTKPVREIMKTRGVETLYVLPMMVGEAVVGTVGLDILDAGRLLTEQQLNLAETIVYQAATAVQNARLFAEAEERAQQLAVLNEVAHVVSQHMEPDQLFKAVHEQIQRVIFSDAFFVGLYDEEKQLVHLPFTFDDGQIYEEESIPAHPDIEVVRVIQTGEPILENFSPEQHAHEQATNDTLMGTMKSPTSMLFVPLRSGMRVIGAISVQNYQFHPYTEADQNLLLGIANHLAVAMENVRLFRDAEQRAAELSLINAVSEIASSQLALPSLFASVGELLQKTFSAASLYFALYDKRAEMITFPYFFTDVDGVIDITPRSFEQGGYTGQIIAARESFLRIVESELPGEQMEAEGAQIIGSGQDTDCYLGTPMIVGNEVVGVVGLNSYREVRTYNEQDQHLLETLADTIGVAIQNIRQFQEAQRRAERGALINRINQKIQLAPTVESALQTAVAELGQALKLKKAVVELSTTKQQNGHKQETSS